MGFPELPGAFEAALVLTAGRFNGSRTQRFVGFEVLSGSGLATGHGFPGPDDFAVLHPVFMILEVIDLRLDFLLQELNREANTVLSKSTEIAIKDAGLVIKAEVEKLREQVQNVE